MTRAVATAGTTPSAEREGREATLGIAEVRVRAVLQETPNAGRATLARRGPKRMPTEGRIDAVDCHARRDQPIDDVEALMVGRHDQCAEGRVGRRPIVEPARDVAGGRRLLDAVDRAPAAISTSTTGVMPKTAACSRAVPPGTPPASSVARASTSAPASIRARATSASP